MLPIVVRRWTCLDEWDAAIFVVGLGVGLAVAMAIGLASLAVWSGFVVGFAGLSVRRLLDRRVLEREAQRPAKELSGLGLLFLALGCFALLIALCGWAILALLVLTFDDPMPKIEIAEGLGGLMAGTMVALALIRFGRGLRL